MARPSFSEFLSQWSASIVILSGPATGTEHTVDQQRVSLGRGPGVDLAFDDKTMSRQHAVLEFSDGAYRLRDLGSCSGTRLNGGTPAVAELKHGDAFELGNHSFQFQLQERDEKMRAGDVDPRWS